MSIGEISDSYDDVMGDFFGVPEKEKTDTVYQAALLIFSRGGAKSLPRSAPLSGSAKVSIEKDDDGDTSVTAQVTVSSSDGNVTVSGSGSVDQDGSVSGKIEATINWQNDD